MPPTKISFKSRIPTVQRIIEEAKGPIGYTELHKRLIEETGIKISRHTLNKCLEYLGDEKRIKKIEEKGVGNPVKYSTNIEWYSMPQEHIKEDNHWKTLSNEISGILVELILVLYAYSQRNNRKKFEDYRDGIEISIFPRTFKIHKQAKCPVILGKKTTEILNKEFYKICKNFRNRVFHMPDKITKEEYKKICHLIREELGELYLDTGDPDYLFHIVSKDFEPVDPREYET